MTTTYDLHWALRSRSHTGLGCGAIPDQVSQSPISILKLLITDYNYYNRLHDDYNLRSTLGSTIYDHILGEAAVRNKIR
jgi:hypothetical protein